MPSHGRSRSNIATRPMYHFVWDRHSYVENFAHTREASMRGDVVSRSSQVVSS